MRWIGVAIGLALVAFCLFGFKATFEEGVPNATAFRFGYAAIGIASLLGVVRLLVVKKQPPE